MDMKMDKFHNVTNKTIKPNLFYNKKRKMGKEKYTIGIDEVGRGPLAGPVTVAAVALLFKLKIKSQKLKIPLRDSKKLSPRQREIWFEYIKKHPQIFYALASVSPKVIDRINISKAANLAATRAFIKLAKNRELKNKKCKVFLDGGLYLPKFLNSIFYFLDSKTIIRGDEKIPAIMLASIVAKVSRDKLMCHYGKKFPQYGFAQHKGYGTKRHFGVIKKYGLIKIHRLTFLRKILRIKKK